MDTYISLLYLNQRFEYEHLTCMKCLIKMTDHLLLYYTKYYLYIMQTRLVLDCLLQLPLVGLLFGCRNWILNPRTYFIQPYVNFALLTKPLEH